MKFKLRKMRSFLSFEFLSLFFLSIIAPPSDARLDLIRDCNEPILQTESDHTIISEFVNTYQNSLQTIRANPTFSLPFPNSNTYAVFPNKINNQISVNLSQFNDKLTSRQERLLLTGIKLKKLIGNSGHDQIKCEDPLNNLDISTKIFYKNGDTIKELEIISIGGEERTFSIFEKRRFKPVIPDWITIVIGDGDQVTEVCAQFELYGCRVRHGSKGEIELSEVVETIHPPPDHSETDTYTGECAQGSCYGGVGSLTDGIRGTCNEWSRYGEFVSSSLELWFILDSREDVQAVVLYGESNAVSNAFKYRVGFGLEGRGTSYRLEEIHASSNGVYRMRINTQEYFSVRSVTSRYVLISLATQEPGTLKLCDIEIHNQFGALTPKQCTIDINENIVKCSNPTNHITYESSERIEEFEISEQLSSSNGNLNNGRELIATTSMSVTQNVTNTSVMNTSTSPIETSISTPTIPSSINNSTQMLIYIGVGAAGVIIISVIKYALVAIVLVLYRARRKRIRKSRPPDFPWSNCVLYGVNNRGQPNRPFQEAFWGNQVMNVRTELSPENGGAAPDARSKSPETVVAMNETHTYEEVICVSPSVQTEADS